MTNPYKTPEADLSTEVRSELALASRGLRFAGALIDSLVTGLPAIGIAYTMGFYDSLGPDGAMPLTDQFVVGLMGMGIFLLINGYLIYKRGQTIGKMICRTRVVTLRGEQVSGNTYLFARLMPVWLLSQIPVVGAIFSVADSLLIFRKDHNCLHDDIAKTRVVMA